MAKKKWEVQRLKEDKEWEEKMAWEEADEELLTYTREDAYNKVDSLFISFSVTDFT